MARRQYISGDKHLADAVRKLVREHGLIVTTDGGTHKRLSTPDGVIVGTISTSQFSGPATLKSLAKIRRNLASIKGGT